MEKEWVEQTLRAIKANDWRIDKYEENWASIMAEVIAQAHEQELANAIAHTRAGMVGDVQRLEAQVAVMGGAIELALEARFWVANVPEYTRDWDKVKQVLSAAPKVVWHGKGLLFDDQRDGKVLTVTGLDWRTGGIEVDVIALECPRRPEQEQSTEQPQGSEEGYKRARGVIPWHEGDEPPEDTITRIRGRSQKNEGESWSEYRHRIFPNMYAEGHRRIGPNGEDLDSEQGQESEQPSLVDTFAELGRLVGQGLASIDDVEAWVREIRGSQEEG